MGLKDELIEAKTQALLVQGVNPDNIDTSVGTALEVEANLMMEAIVNFLTNVEFRITQLRAPVIVEELKTPDLPVNVELETLMGDKAPLLGALKQIPGAAALIDPLEAEIKKAITPLLEGGSTLPGLDLGKDSGGLECIGYVYIGEDPNSVDEFDVEDENGQREFTSVKLLREDIEDLL